MLMIKINYYVGNNEIVIKNVTEYDDETHRQTFFSPLDITYRYIERVRKFLALMKLNNSDIVQLDVIDDRNGFSRRTNKVFNATVDNFIAVLESALKAVKAE